MIFSLVMMIPARLTTAGTVIKSGLPRVKKSSRGEFSSRPGKSQEIYFESGKIDISKKRQGKLKSFNIADLIPLKAERNFIVQSEMNQTNATRSYTFSRALRPLRIFSLSFDWSTGFSVSFVIGQGGFFALNRPVSESPCASVSKRVLVQNLSYKNEFDLHENEHVGGTHFHMNGFALRLVLTQRRKAI